jgi:rfaE bifunctional protein nucleotidyltransferase chain/domain
MTIVATSGCFDLLLPGHVEYLRQARKLGDFLVVLVADDDRVAELKGEGRPINSLWDRTKTLRELRCVDSVMPYSGDPSDILANLRPDFYVKGPDYEGRKIPGEEAVRAYGGHVVCVSHSHTLHTTDILRAQKSPE